MKIAHVIFAHNDPQQIARLIRRLEHPDADFYIHIDKKTDAGPFMELQKIGRVFFIKNRVKCNWGGYGIVQAINNAFKEILDTTIDYGYINLLSGQDYPLVATETIHDFFKENPDKIFIHAEPIDEVWTEAIPRVKKYDLVDYSFPGRFMVQKLINSLLPGRKIPGNLVPYGRSQWFTIAPFYAAYFVNYLEQNPNIVKFFKLSWGPDEIIFQTVLCNSPYKDHVVNDHLRYIHFPAGKSRPKVLTMADAEDILKSGKFFARKFSPSVDSHILDFLDHKAGFMPVE